MAKTASRMAKAMLASMKRNPQRDIANGTKMIYMASPKSGEGCVWVGSGWRYAERLDPVGHRIIQRYWLVEFHTGTVRVDPQDCLIWR